jgi:predicted DNA-binding protein YlxM (UPF0122 family)
MDFDKTIKINLLYDCYGQLLTRRQQEMMAFYYEENMSLAEIAGEVLISRQGVHDALRNAEKALIEYEEKLGLMEKLILNRRAIMQIDRAIDEIMKENKKNLQLVKKLDEIKRIIDDFDQ